MYSLATRLQMELSARLRHVGYIVRHWSPPGENEEIEIGYLNDGDWCANEVGVEVTKKGDMIVNRYVEYTNGDIEVENLGTFYSTVTCGDRVLEELGLDRQGFALPGARFPIDFLKDGSE